MSHVLIVGGGVGGLCAAVVLAAAGHAVTLCEAHARLGGKAQEHVVDGVAFDTGPSVVTLPYVFDEVFRRAGTTLAEQLTIRAVEPATRYHLDDGRSFDLFADREARHAALSEAFSPADADALEAFLAHAGRIWAAAEPHFVRGPAPSLPGLLATGWSGLAALPQLDAFRTMQGRIDASLQADPLRWAMARFATYNGSDPRRAPGTLNCIAHVELVAGVYGIDGGLYRLVDALAATARAHGAALRAHTPVQQLTRVHGRWQAQVEGGPPLVADAVLVNADVAHLTSHLLPPGTVPRRLARRATPSTSGWTAVYKARRRADRPAHAVLFPPDYAEEFRALFDRDRPPQMPTVYLCAQEKAHRRTGWSEHEPLFVMANAPAEGEVPTAEGLWTALGQTVHARLVEHGLVDPDDQPVWSRSPTDLARHFPGSQGALYGAASNDPFAAFRRPPNRVPSLPGLYLASGSAHPGGGLPMVARSGLTAADALLHDLETP